MMKICGLDEVGRGALAGPLVAAIAAIPKAGLKLKDSKMLSKKRREELYREIMASGAETAVEIITVRQINNKGIGWANKEIFRRLIRKVRADRYIVDGNLKLYCRNSKVKCVIKADKTRKSVMAAAIVAKVTRDRLMTNLHQKFPGYGWNKNVGYGTKDHIDAIKLRGTVQFHRDVFVTTVLKNEEAA